MAGFAGLSAARYLAKHTGLVDVTLVDKYENNHFRPLIPDVISHAVGAPNLLYSLLPFKDRYRFRLFCESVQNINFSSREIDLLEHKISYDYLIMASGSQTPFPPSGLFRQYALRLDSVHDANRLRDAVSSGKYDRFVVCGGGYTGVELASNLQRFITDRKSDEEVIVVEMTDHLISTLPPWMQKYVAEGLKSMGVSVRLSTKVESLTEREIILSNGDSIECALCIWTTGLVAPSIMRTINVPKAAKGRIKVDETLKFSENCFAAGDSACFPQKTSCLRMSVQFSIDQGRTAAKNIIATIGGLPLTPFKPRDPGFIIPLANGKSCGEVFGIPVRGRVATLLHYLISTYRSPGVMNRIGVLKGAFRAL